MTPNTPHTVGHAGWSPDYKSSPMPPVTGKLIARRSAAACSVAVDLTDAENTALDALCAQKEMTRQGVMRAALRLYQAVALGAAEVTWKPTGLPVGCMGDDCPPNVEVEAPPPMKSDCAETEKLMGGCPLTPCSFSSL